MFVLILANVPNVVNDSLASDANDEVSIVEQSWVFAKCFVCNKVLVEHVVTHMSIVIV